MAAVFGRLGYDVRLEHHKDEALDLLGSPAIFGEHRSVTLADAQGSNDEQFRVFNLVAEGDKHRFVDPHDTKPQLGGSAEKPDIRARLELIGFNPGPVDMDRYDGATLRLDVGQDSLSQSSLRPLFWSIAAGLDLAALFDGDTASRDAPRRFSADYQSTFGNRPIEVPGGLAEIRFEVVLNRKKPWWRDLFSFLHSDTAGKAMAAFGFPGIAVEAIKIIDQAFDVLADDSESLFKSERMRFALSDYAHQEFTMGMPGIRLGVINRGFSLLARARDYALIQQEEPQYLAGYQTLVPSSWTLRDFLNSNPEDNPFHRVPYAVLRIRSEAASLAGSL